MLDLPKEQETRKRRHSSGNFSTQAQVESNLIIEEEEALDLSPEIRNLNKVTLEERFAWIKKYGIEPFDEHYCFLDKELNTGLFQHQESTAKDRAIGYNDWLAVSGVAKSVDREVNMLKKQFTFLKKNKMFLLFNRN